MHIIFQKGFAAARKNLIPGLLLQGFALIMVLFYYRNPEFHDVLQKIPEFKQRSGLLFPTIGTAFFGGMIPFLFLISRGEIARGRRLAELLFLLGFWAFNGLTVDLFYRAQAVMFGDQTDFPTVLKKVLVDQLVYSVFWSPPFMVLALHWKNCGYSLRRSATQFRMPEATIQLFSIMIANWGVWVPTVSIIYSLPLGLQFPLFNIVLCFWSLMLAAIDKGDSPCTSSETVPCPSV